MTDHWTRLRPRDDDTDLLPYQVLNSFGDTWWEDKRPAASHESQVRMDIQTAVRIASTHGLPPPGLCIIDLLMETEPAKLDPLSGPLPSIAEVFVSNMIDKTAALRARMARQNLVIDSEGMHRRRAMDTVGKREDRMITALTWVSLGIVLTMIALVLGLITRALVSPT